MYIHDCLSVLVSLCINSHMVTVGLIYSNYWLDIYKLVQIHEFRVTNGLMHTYIYTMCIHS